MTISFSQALALIERRCVPVSGVERVVLARAEGRFLAEDTIAPIDVPAADNSAVDGYAFRRADLARPPQSAGSEQRSASAHLKVVGVSAAGRPSQHKLEFGEAVRIFTGALPPEGSDAIAMQEEVTADGDGFIRIEAHIPSQANIRRAGEDIRAGSVAFTIGRRLGPAELGMLASLGIGSVLVHRKLRVAVLSIGDELIDPGAERRSGQIYDANRPSLLALLHRLGMETTDCGVVPDRPDSIAMTLERAIANHDAIVASAGVSVGDEDHTRRVAGRLGRLDFSGVAIKPGKPVSFGEIGGVPFFALPGNPAAMLICCMTLAVPGLKRLAGATITAPRSFPVRADFELRRRPGPREFLRCTLHREPEGQILARRFPHGGAGVLSSIAQSDGLIMIEEELGEIPPGLMLPFIPYAELDL